MKQNHIKCLFKTRDGIKWGGGQEIQRTNITNGKELQTS